MHLIRIARRIWLLLEPRERRRSLWLGLLMLALTVVEMSGLASVVPLVSTVMSADGCARFGAVLGGVCAQLQVSANPLVLALVVFALIASSNLLAFGVTWASARVTWAVWARLSHHAFAGYLDKPFEYFFSDHTSQAVKNTVYETERFANFVFMPLLLVISRSTVIAGILLLVIVADPRLSLGVIVLLAAIYLLLYRQLARRVRRSGELAFSSRSAISRIATDSLAGIREIRMLDAATHFQRQYRSAAEVLTRQYVYTAVVGVLPRYAIETTAFGAALLLAVYLSGSLGGWREAAPVLVLFLFAAYRLLPQFQQIYANAVLVQQNSPVVDELARLLQDGARTTPGRLAAQQEHLQPPIVLASVSYRYPGRGEDVIQDARMEIPRASTVGLVGATGSGKSTIIDLIAGLIAPTGGEILLDGRPLKGARVSAWRKHLGYVPQVLFLLDDTIRRNIAFGLDDVAISQAQVERAARAANIHGFITSLPEGYDTVVGERGVRLSGGQRQRLVIARALYRDPEVLIFDEATSALDTETEQAVMEAIRSLSHRKTLLIISHRPATLEGCDLVYEVADGKIRRR